MTSRTLNSRIVTEAELADVEIVRNIDTDSVAAIDVIWGMHQYVTLTGTPAELQELASKIIDIAYRISSQIED